MIKKNKDKTILKQKPNFFLLYFITTILFLTYFLLSTILIKISHKEQNQKVYIRKLQTNQMGGTSDGNYYKNNTDSEDKDEKKSDDDFNPFYYLFGFYMIFIMMSIYMVCILSRSNIRPEYEKEIKKNLFLFLYFANNGSLFVSLIFLSSVFKASGFLPFGIGLVVLGVGTYYYISKMKANCKEILSDDNNNTKVKNLIKIPCTIIDIIIYTYECCRCEYYNIKTTTYYTDGTKETTYCCSSILCLFWNIYWLAVKVVTTFFMIIAYYIFFGIFLIFWLLAKLIYFKLIKKSGQEEKSQENDKKSHDTNINEQMNNNNFQGINQILPTENSLIKHNVPNEKSDNVEHNKIGSNFGLTGNIVNNNNINNTGENIENNNIKNDINIFVDDKINKNKNFQSNINDEGKKVNFEEQNPNFKSTDELENNVQSNVNDNINKPA